MEKYYFIVDDGGSVVEDETGTLFADDQAAREHALRIIDELKADSSFAASNGQMIVTRGDQEIFRIPFSSVP
jgi:hypothetical protein